MPFLASHLTPSTSRPAEAGDNIFDASAAAGVVTALQTPPDALLTEGLAAALRRAGRRPLWIRLSAEDRDPATFVLSVVSAAQRERADFGRQTLQLMRRHPGPLGGWQPLLSCLAQELIKESGWAALVLEQVDPPNVTPPCRRACIAWRRRWRCIPPATPPRRSCSSAATCRVTCSRSPALPADAAARVLNGTGSARPGSAGRHYPACCCRKASDRSLKPSTFS